MATSHGPKIVTDNLLFCIDAGNTKSYSGSGNDWHDLTANGYDGTLMNTTFTNNGIEFNGTNSYCGTLLTVNAIGSNFTVCCFFSRGDTPGTGNHTSDRIISCPVGFLDTTWCIGINQSGDLQFAGDGGDDGEPTVEIDINTNYFFALKYSSSASYDMFVNDIKEVSNKGVTIGSTDNSTVSIGILKCASSTLFPYNGIIYYVAIYNVALSDQEILQNYNALKGRFGL